MFTSGSGYNKLSAPTSSHIIGGPDLELGDLSNPASTDTAFFDTVSSLRTSLHLFESSITTLATRHAYSLSNPSVELAAQIDGMSGELREQGNVLRKGVGELGTQVGRDEVKRGHWEGLKAGLGRAVGRWQGVERAQRERVRERVARQYRIVKPDATDEEVKEVLESNQGGQIFMQAVAGSRTEGAQAALSEAKTRRAEVQKIEETLVELAMLFTQVSELVASQDQQFITVEDTTRMIEEETGEGVKQLGMAKVSAAAARHKRKLCAGFFAVILLIIVIVIVVEVKQAEGPANPSNSTTAAVTSDKTSGSVSLSATSDLTSAATSAKESSEAKTTLAATTSVV